MKRKIILGILTATLAHPLTSQASLVEVGLEPIIGYDRVQKIIPHAHTSDRLVYGARARVGIPLLSLEAEFTRGTDTESYPDQDLTVKDSDDKLKVGLRSSIRLTSLFSVQVRAGGQAKQNTHEETSGGATTRTVGAIVYKPYAGLGLSSRLSNKLILTGAITAVFNDFPHMNQNEYQSTLGFTVKLP